MGWSLRALGTAVADLEREVAELEKYAADLEKEIARLSRHMVDTVAEVPLRSVWESIVDARLATAAQRTTVAWADVDDFKRINDLFGHLAGDVVLREIARRLKTVFAPRSPVVTRLGGDEFGIVVQDAELPGDLQRFARRMAEPVALPQGSSVRVEVSVGVAQGAHLPCELTREDLLLVADADLYAVKRAKQRHTPLPRTGPVEVVGSVL